MEDIIEDLQLRRAGGRCYLIDTANAGMPYHKPVVVNETGAEFFLGMKEGKTKEEIVRNIADHYGVTAERVAEDLDRFLTDLKSRYVIWR